MTSVTDIFLQWVFPLLGGIVGTLMFMAPVKAVLNARRAGDLGSLNPIPYPAQTANAAAWIAYSYVIVSANKAGSALLFWPNFIGFLLGLFFTLTCHGLANKKTKDYIMIQVWFFAFILPLIGAIGVLTGMSDSKLKVMWGFTANGILLIYYTAPLSTVVTVIKTRSAETLDFPMVLMQTINGGLWVGYGAAVADPFIYVPNTVGICTGIFLCVLIFMYRKPKVSKIVEDADFPELPSKVVEQLDLPLSPKAVEDFDYKEVAPKVVELDLDADQIATAKDIININGQGNEQFVIQVLEDEQRQNEEDKIRVFEV